jgi:hypothetical protein
MSTKYKVNDAGEVIWSDIILVKPSGGCWAPFSLADGWEDSQHNVYGFKKWMASQKIPYKLGSDTEFVYYFKESGEKFWFPLALPCRDKVCRRTTYSQWTVFRASRRDEILTFQTFAEWKNWASGWELERPIRSNSGWELERLKRMERGDQRVWVYVDDYLFFPEPKDPYLVTCVNPLGCYLTKNKTYEVQGQEDGLLQVVDDSGVKQFFLPERFTDAKNLQ